MSESRPLYPISHHIENSVARESAEPLSTSFICGLFLLFLVSTVIPVFSLPGVGLSISAPLMFFIALEVLLGRRTLTGRTAEKRWTVPLLLLIYGILFSVLANLLFRQVAMGTDVAVTLLRYGYWWLVFLVVANISSHKNWMHRIIIVLGISAIGLAVVRVLDAFLLGGWGLHTAEFRPRFLTKNLYGIQFSSFSAFAFILPFVVNRKYRFFAFAGVLFLVIVILANGSRGNWLALVAGGSVWIAVYSITHSAHGQWVWALPLLFILIVFQVPLPGQIGEVVNRQLDTFENLDADKAYEYRQVMIQKGLILFQKHPIAGIGLNQFKKTYVPELVIPPILGRHPNSFIAGSPHNSYIQYLAEVGLVGTIPFAFLLIRLALQGTQAAIHFSRRQEPWALGVLWGFIAMSVHLWSLAGLGSTGPWLIYGLVAGMIVHGQSSELRGSDIHLVSIEENRKLTENRQGYYPF